MYPAWDLAEKPRAEIRDALERLKAYPKPMAEWLEKFGEVPPGSDADGVGHGTEPPVITREPDAVRLGAVKVPVRSIATS